MKILVCIKQVPDTGSVIPISADKKGIKESGLEWIISPYDEFALEEALQIKEKKGSGEVTALSLGPARAEKALRQALALGADKAVLIESENKSFSSNFNAWFLSQVIKKDMPDLIFTGKAGADTHQGATGYMLAESLNIPHAGFVTKMREKTDKLWLCESSASTQSIEEVLLRLPALITVEKGINKPRYASLPGIMKAKKKPLEKIKLSTLEPAPPLLDVKFESYKPPPAPPACLMISGEAREQAQKLVAVLRQKEKII